MRPPCDRLPQPNWLGEALEGSDAKVLELESSARQAIGGIGHNDTVRLRLRLNARRKRGCDADHLFGAWKRGVRQVRDHDQAGCDANPNTKGRSEGTFLCEVLAPGYQVEGREDSALRRIFRRDGKRRRCAAVAEQPVEMSAFAPIAAAASDGSGVRRRADLRIEVSEELR